MEKSWSTTKFKITKLGKNFFQFFFESSSDQLNVLQNGPWCFDNILLILKQWKPNLSSESAEFLETPFWIQIIGLPMHLLTEDVGRRIATDLNDCTFIQIREEAGTNQLLFRCRASIHIIKPLPQLLSVLVDSSQQTTPNNDSFTALFQYERLPSFCFHCSLLGSSLLGHTARNCPQTSEDFNLEVEKNFRYGPWLTASKRTKLIKELRLLDMDLQMDPSPALSSGNISSHKGEQHQPATPCSVNLFGKRVHLVKRLLRIKSQKSLIWWRLQCSSTPTNECFMLELLEMKDYTLQMKLKIL